MNSLDLSCHNSFRGPISLTHESTIVTHEFKFCILDGGWRPGHRRPARGSHRPEARQGQEPEQRGKGELLCGDDDNYGSTVPLEGAETPRMFVVIATAGTRAYRHVGVEIFSLLSKLSTLLVNKEPTLMKKESLYLLLVLLVDSHGKSQPRSTTQRTE